VETASEHPLATAIVTAASDRGIALPKVEDFDSPVGKGALGQVEGRRIAIGNADFLASLGVKSDALQAKADELRADGATVVFVAAGDRLAGLLAIADPVKAQTPAALEGLRAQGLHIVMLTGDNRKTAEAVARKLGIDEVEAEVLPDGKS